MFEFHQQIIQMAILLLTLPLTLIFYGLFIESFSIGLSPFNLPTINLINKKHKEILCLN